MFNIWYSLKFFCVLVTSQFVKFYEALSCPLSQLDWSSFVQCCIDINDTVSADLRSLISENKVQVFFIRRRLTSDFISIHLTQFYVYIIFCSCSSVWTETFRRITSYVISNRKWHFKLKALWEWDIYHFAENWDSVNRTRNQWKQDFLNISGKTSDWMIKRISNEIFSTDSKLRSKKSFLIKFLISHKILYSGGKNTN